MENAVFSGGSPGHAKVGTSPILIIGLSLTIGGFLSIFKFIYLFFLRLFQENEI